MKHLTARPFQIPLKKRYGMAVTPFVTTLLLLMILTAPGHADPVKSPVVKGILIESIDADAQGVFGYLLEYYVPAPIDAVWRLKTDFDSDILEIKVASKYKRRYLAAMGN